MAQWRFVLPAMRSLLLYFRYDPVALSPIRGRLRQIVGLSRSYYYPCPTVNDSRRVYKNDNVDPPSPGKTATPPQIKNGRRPTMGIVQWVRNWFKDAPVPDAPAQEAPAPETSEQDNPIKTGARELTARRNAWFQRENQCEGSSMPAVRGSVRTVVPAQEQAKRRRRGRCQECKGVFSVSRSSKVAVHQRRV